MEHAGGEVPKVLGRGGLWKVGKELGRGAFSTVHEAVFAGDDIRGEMASTEWVLKVSKVPLAASLKKRKKDAQTPGATLLHREYTVYRILGETAARERLQLGEEAGFGLPKMPSAKVEWRYSSNSDGWCYLAMERLGPTVQAFVEANRDRGDSHMYMNIAAQCLWALRTLHKSDYIFRDVKPENFMLGRGETSGRVYIVDMGATCAGHNSKGLREPASPIGTPLFMSRSIHGGNPPVPRDDLESLGYMLVWMLAGTLPWENASSDAQVEKRKAETFIEELCGDIQDEEICDQVERYLNIVWGLGREENIPYHELAKTLSESLGCESNAMSLIAYGLKPKAKGKSKQTLSKGGAKSRQRKEIAEVIDVLSSDNESREDQDEQHEVGEIGENLEEGEEEETGKRYNLRSKKRKTPQLPPQQWTQKTHNDMNRTRKRKQKTEEKVMKF